MTTALVTGASRGLGRALAHELAARGHDLVIDARGAAALAIVADDLAGVTRVAAVPGDLTDAAHRRDLAAAASEGIDLLVLNASILGPSPLPSVDRLDPADLRELLEVNVVAQLATYQAVAPHLSAGATVVVITSDAAVAAYPGWGGYGASKAAAQHLAAVLAEERADLRVLAVDPGDMRTAMYQAAFPGEDVSDRPDPATVAPVILDLVDAGVPSGRLAVPDVLAGRRDAVTARLGVTA